MVYSIVLSLLLGFELSYYLLIIQTGLVEHYNSNLIALFPMFFGGILGTISAGLSWGKIRNPIHKIYIALSLQLVLSFLYPNYSIFTLALLGFSVGLMAPLGIYLFKGKYHTNFLFALAIAYTTGTYFYNLPVENRLWIAVLFTAISMLSAIVLKEYKIESKNNINTFSSYIPLMLWVFLDSNLFESISRQVGVNIWSIYTNEIILFHLMGLVAAYYIRINISKQHTLIALIFIVSYTFYYLEMPLALLVIYPFIISYYSLIAFRVLSKEQNLLKLSFIMVFVGWIASGLGLGLALENIL